MKPLWSGLVHISQLRAYGPLGLFSTILLLLSFSVALFAKCITSYLVFMFSWLALMSPSFPSISLHSFVPAHICTLLLSSPSLVHLLASLFKLKSYVAPYFLVSEQNKCQISPMHPVVNRLGPFHCAYSAFFSIHRLSCCMHLLMSGHTTLSDRESLPSSTPL